MFFKISFATSYILPNIRPKFSLKFLKIYLNFLKMNFKNFKLQTFSRNFIRNVDNFYDEKFP